MTDTKPAPVKNSGDLIEADLYEDLLSRYERALVYAGELREKLRGQERLSEESQELKRDVRRLEKSVAVDEAYIRLLESALEKLGILSFQPLERLVQRSGNNEAIVGSATQGTSRREEEVDAGHP